MTADERAALLRAAQTAAFLPQQPAATILLPDIAYLLANNLQPIVDAVLIEPLVNWFAPLATSALLLHEILVGDYGVLTLGWHSFSTNH
jgi:hypothetical protein